MKRILIIEDDETIAAIERDYLVLNEFEVDIVGTGSEGIARGRCGNYDLILLDLMLPEMDGFTVCRILRESLDIPILMVTARQEDIDKIKGLGMGADDYITKPFRVRELISRIKSVLRRYKGDSNHSQFKLGDLRVNTSEARVWKQGEEVLLTALEYRLLLAFLNHPGQVLTRGQLLENIWDVAGDFVNDNTLTVYIKRLRDKLEQDPQDPQIIKTVRGVGYKLEKEGQL